MDNSSPARPAVAKEPPLISPTLLLFLFAMVLANIGGNMYGTLLPLYLKDLGADVGQIGLFFTLSQVIPLALQILGGWLSDSIGRLRAVALGSIGGLFSYAALILAPTWEWLLLASAFSAISGALVAPSFDAFIAESSDPRNRARVFGISQSLFMVVGVIGPLLGGYLADERGYKFMLIVAGSFYLVATLIRISMARRASQIERASRAEFSFAGLKGNLRAMIVLLISGGVITWILITDGILDTAFAMCLNLLPVYMQEIGSLSLKQIGLVNSVFGLAMMVTNIPGGWLADRLGERVGVVLSLLMVGSGLALLIFMPEQNIAFYLLSFILAGSGLGFSNPAIRSLISKSVPDELRGTAFGFFGTSLGLISLPAPWIGGQLWQRFSPRLPFLVAVIASFLVTIPVWFKFRLPEGETQPELATDG